MADEAVRPHPYNDLASIGVAVRWFSEHDQVHAGILLRLDEEIQLCHLEFHHRLKLEIAGEGYFWADCPMFSGNRARVANADFFAAWLLDVAENPSIPYGFAFDERCFDENGKFLSMELGKGLTCATFIIAVFHSAGMPIVQTQTWQARPDDVEWQAKILEFLKKVAEVDHAEAAASYIGHFRYRPEEVVAGAINAPPPSTFEECLPVAEKILSTIRSS